MVQVEKCNGFCDVVERNADGVLLKRHAEVCTDTFEHWLDVMLAESPPCAKCGEPIPAGDCDRCEACLVASFEPDYDALAAQEPTSQYQDSREAAGVM